MITSVLVSLSLIAFYLSICQSYLLSRTVIEQRYTHLWYDYFKKGPEKKEIGRLWKNIIFPGIYVEYADTKETKQTVKIETKYRNDDERNEGIVTSNLGTYQEVDSSSAPKIVSSTQLGRKMKPIAKPVGFKAPVPKRATLLPIGTGMAVIPDIAKYTRPKKPIVLYEYESSPQCRKVREACSMLDLTVEFRPCPGARYGFSDIMTTFTSGKRDVPFMMDPNPSMYKPQLMGEKEIIEYLFKTYGPGIDKIPSNLKGKTSNGGGFFGIGGIGSGGKGSRLRSNARSDIALLRPLTLYGWEGEGKFVRPVRETLNELGLSHIFINCANGSQNRAKLQQKTGLFQVPYLIDPNTGVEMFESQEIIKYLETVYTA